MTRVHTLICTVGTSLATNLKQKVSSPERHEFGQLAAAFEKGDLKRVSQTLLKLSPSERLCGAEVNTISQLLEQKELAVEQIYFLVSDTQEGALIGEILRLYAMRNRRWQLRQVYVETIEDLNDDPVRFSSKGLRNLVRKIGEIILKAGGPEFVAIDATGGYKAQIAIAVIVGQALGIPIFYKHEKFSTIIDFPPLPVSLDYSLLAENAHLLHVLERGELIASEDIIFKDKRIKVLLNWVDIDGQRWCELSPFGQIYLTSFRIKNPKRPELVPAADKKRPTFGNDHHFPEGFKEFLTRVWNKTPWIITAYSIDYSGQRGIKGIGFHVKDGGLVATYRKKDHGARARLILTDESDQALVWAADYLNRKFSD